MNQNYRALLGLGLFALLLTACPTVSPISAGTLSILPAGPQTIRAGTTPGITFTASGVTGNISWALGQGSPGSISPVSGNSTTYLPPSGGISRNTPATLTAQVSGTTVSQSVTITVEPATGGNGDGGNNGGSDGGAAPSGTLWIPNYDDGTVVGFPGSELGGSGTKALTSTGTKLLAFDAGTNGPNYAEGVAFDSHGNAWVSWQSGLWGFPLSGSTFGFPDLITGNGVFGAGFLSPYLVGEAFGPDGTFWVADRNNGLWGFTPSELSSPSPSPTFVSSVTTTAGLDSLESPSESGL